MLLLDTPQRRHWKTLASLSIPSRMLRPEPRIAQSGLPPNFQFLLGCFRYVCKSCGYELHRFFQFLLGCFLTTAPLGAVVVYKVFQFLLGCFNKIFDLKQGMGIFQFLLGCFIFQHGIRQRVPYPLSIPSRMLRVSTLSPPRRREDTFNSF